MTPQLIYMPLFSSFLPISVLAQHYYLPRTVIEPEKEPLLLLQSCLDSIWRAAALLMSKTTSSLNGNEYGEQERRRRRRLQ